MNDLTIGIVKESETFLGNYAKNALINIDGSATIYAGLNKEMKMNDTTFFGGVNFGLTKLNIDEAMMKSSDTMVSNSMSMGAKYKTDIPEDIGNRYADLLHQRITIMNDWEKFLISKEG